MAELFSVTVPLLIRFADGREDVMVECIPHDEGLVYFRPFWDQMDPGEGLQQVTGELRGEGPWKVGSAVITVLGCHGTNPEQAAVFADWQLYRQQLGDSYPDKSELLGLARAAGY